MNHLLPKPDTLPLAWGWFKFLLMLTFPLHLLLMNAMLGATAISLYARWKKGDTSLRLAHGLARTIPFLVAFAVNLGVAALLFLQVLYGQFFYTSSILMAVFWLGIIPLLMIAYYLLYLYDFKYKALGAAGIPMVFLVFIIFLGIAFVFTNNMTLMLLPQKWSAYFGNSAGTILNLDDPTLWPRYLHFVVGGTAIGGLFVALYGKVKEKTDQEMGKAAISMGMKTFTSLTLVQIVDGFWFLLLLPPHVTRQFMGSDPLATVLFLAGLLLSLAVLITGKKGRLYLCAGLAASLVFVMSSMRDLVRTGFLQAVFSPASLKVVPQYSPMLMFFFMLMVGCVLMGWMIGKAAKSGMDDGGSGR